MVKRLARDERGQTMLEQVVIVVCVVIVAIVGFRLIKGTVGRSTKKASYAIEANTERSVRNLEPYPIDPY
ncbi:hypothetical protein JXD38_11210 [candidate division WOR-3 bacterium]|nr:hypothetical protein [candidate division WOR-3 bacterium]